MPAISRQPLAGKREAAHAAASLPPAKCIPMIQDSNGSGEPLADRRADYAARLAEDGAFAAAADLMRQALDLAPGWAAGWVVLGGFLECADMTGDALDAYRQAAALDAADGHGARMKLAALGAAPLPASAPPAFVRGLFDQYADRFETSLVDRLGYGAPLQLIGALGAVAGPHRRFAEVLDLGCGTGLMGERLRPTAGNLTGVDLSAGMLDKARRKKIYDRLVESDVVGFGAGTQHYDLVTAADVLIYIGDLAPLFAGVATALAPGGLFTFSVETHDGEAPYALGPSLRFAHAPAAVEAMLDDCAMRMLSKQSVVLRQDRGEAVMGMIFVAGSGS